MVTVRYELDDSERQALLEIRRQGTVKVIAFDDAGHFVTEPNYEVVLELSRVGLARRIGLARADQDKHPADYELTDEGVALAEELEHADTNPGVAE